MRQRFDIGVGSSCPHCKTGEMTYKKSKYGSFLSCSRFPNCAFSQSIIINEELEEDYYFNNDGDSEESDLIFN